MVVNSHSKDFSFNRGTTEGKIHSIVQYKNEETLNFRKIDKRYFDKPFFINISGMVLLLPCHSLGHELYIHFALFGLVDG